MDKCLYAIDLHESRHGCHDKRGTAGTAVIEAKLAQQLAHLEHVPFYGIFLDLKKAFDAIDGPGTLPHDSGGVWCRPQYGTAHP